MSKPSTKKMYAHELNKFQEYLKHKGLRMSNGRALVFKAVYHFHGHFSAEDLVKTIQKKKLRVSRATIYRSVNELLEAQVIRQTAFGKKHHNYEHVYDEKPHHHAFCIRSGKFFELPDLGEEEKYLPVLDKMGFQVLGHEVHFYGISKEYQES